MGGDFVDAEVGELLSQANAPELIARAWLEHCEGRKGIAFAPTVATAHDIARAMSSPS